MQKENKNSKRVQPKPKQEKKQWQQRHHLHSEKCYRQQKKSGKKANVRNKILWTENNFFSNRKRPKGRQKNKTATSRPTLTLPNTLPTGQRKFRFQFFKKKVTNQDFLKKIRKNSIGREKQHNCADAPSLVPSITHERIRGFQIGCMTSTACVSCRKLVRYLSKDSVKFLRLSQLTIWLA